MASLVKCARCGIVTYRHIPVSLRYGTEISNTVKVCLPCGLVVAAAYNAAIAPDIRAAS